MIVIDDQRPVLHGVQATAFELLVVEVRLAVGGELDLGADLGLGLADVGQEPEDEADENDEDDDERDALLNGLGGRASVVTAADAVRTLGLLAGGVGADRWPADDRCRCRP